MYPARPRLLHPGLPIGLVVVDPFVVPEGRTRDAVHYDKDDEHDDVDDRDLPPALLQACQHTGLAGVAVVAELLLVVVVPLQTIRISPHEPCSRRPIRLVHVDVAA